MSQNLVKSGDFKLKSGQYGQNQWDSELEFKRFSWYSELTLIFDVFLSDFSEKNDFYNWFGESEKKAVNSCENPYIALSYHLDGKRFSKSQFYHQLREMKAEVIEVPQFSSNLRLHPDFEELSFNLYEAKLICSKGKLEQFKVRVPSYKAVPFKM
ncbi:MAG: hypothetical protein ACPGJV_08865 [Bacteriovoracaceae bacterium]